MAQENEADAWRGVDDDSMDMKVKAHIIATATAWKERRGQGMSEIHTLGVDPPALPQSQSDAGGRGGGGRRRGYKTRPD